MVNEYTTESPSELFHSILLSLQHLNESAKKADSDDYCGLKRSNLTLALSTGFQAFDAGFFRPIRVPLDLSICAFGILTNVLHALIMHQNQNTMFSTINNLLSSLAVSQTLLLLSFIISTVLLPADMCDARFRSFSVVTLLHVVANMSVVFHTAAIGHVTALAIFRYAMVCWPKRFFPRKKNGLKTSTTSSSITAHWIRTPQAFRRRRTAVSLLNQSVLIPLIYIIVAIGCTPFYLDTDVQPLSEGRRRYCEWPNSSDFYTIRKTPLAIRSGLDVVNLWLFSIVCKLVPCVLIVLLNVLLIFKLRQIQRNRALLQNLNAQSPLNNKHREVARSLQEIRAAETVLATTLTGPALPLIPHRPRSADLRKKRHGTVAKILFVVVLLFFVVEFTHAVMNLLSAVCGKPFKDHIFKPLQEFLNTLTVLYSSVSFTLYCLMSSEYREMLRMWLYRTWTCRRQEMRIVREEASLTLDATVENANGHLVEMTPVPDGHRRLSRSFNLHDRRPSADFRRTFSDSRSALKKTGDEAEPFLRDARKLTVGFSIDKAIVVGNMDGDNLASVKKQNSVQY